MSLQSELSEVVKFQGSERSEMALLLSPRSSDAGTAISQLALYDLRELFDVASVSLASNDQNGRSVEGQHSNEDFSAMFVRSSLSTCGRCRIKTSETSGELCNRCRSVV